ncbi:serine hydrolase [Streptomyces sp. ACA25]|uniref:serine hydrolase domain-containing protein n=1 Tax=Streptomyces sp. ACA25 TaxID=3022596 RepID=UPI0023080289|nr:serine hydrolase domain-containing protein [Streptomyces sp. ACA25]MDB1088333.1 serine hydrolase [Streptomyces sp. ACA25]
MAGNITVLRPERPDDLDPASLTRLLSRLAREHRVPGAQLAVRHQNRTLLASTGERVHGTGVAVTAEAAFPLASVTKPFTAALAMVLVADGDVGLDEPLAGCLPEFGAGRSVTLRQLLTHTGGLVANVEEESLPRDRWVTRHCGEHQLAHPPGSGFSYSNAGYVVVGRLVEAVTGMTWREALEGILLDPLGFTAAYAVGPTGRTPVSGHAVHWSGRRTIPVDQQVPAVEEPNGALALSAAELARFAGLFLPGTDGQGLLEKATVAEMCRDQLGDAQIEPYGMASGWGLGWARYTDPDSDAPVFGHDGTGDGISCHLRFQPATGTVIALNTNAGTGQRLWADLAGRLADAGLPGARPQPAAPPASCVPSPPPDAVTGRYINGDLVYDIDPDGAGGLQLSIGGRTHSRLVMGHGLRFTAQEIDDARNEFHGRFLPGAAPGEAPLLQLAGRLARKWHEKG